MYVLVLCGGTLAQLPEISVAAQAGMHFLWSMPAVAIWSLLREQRPASVAL